MRHGVNTTQRQTDIVWQVKEKGKQEKIVTRYRRYETHIQLDEYWKKGKQEKVVMSHREST